ncbi:MAG: phosphatidylglycerol lysyltransferase domain-containing protein, partial [Streptococcaceae bacterium]|nr:phosphatidylglycerol lysyltransferase domain-containing protein [Streptococcaceae bacterium]
RIVQRVFALVLLLTTINLLKRKRIAWIITVSVLILSAILQIIHALVFTNYPMLALFLIKIILLIIFFSTRGDFIVPTDRHSAKMGAIFAGIGILGLLLNVGFGYLMFHSQLGLTKKTAAITSFKHAWSQIFSLGPNVTTTTNLRVPFDTFAFWLTWAGIILCVIYILRPFILKPQITDKLFKKARHLVNNYGQNVASYLALEDDKLLFFSKEVEGIVAYGIVGDTLIVQGDPIAAPQDYPKLLEEFTEFAVKSAHNLFFMSITDKFLAEYEKLGYGFVKCGEEARFDLQEYNLKGKKAAKMRMNINHATKKGYQVLEYKVNEKRELKLDKEFDRISNEWLEGKNSSALGFTVGTVGLENPLDKRYFYAVDELGVMQGFVVFVPFEDEGKGYMADVTRRAKSATWGITELLVYEGFQVFKEEGAKWGSMGVAPLANLENEEKMVARMLQFVYNNLNSIYGFKSLYQAKVKYSPTHWNPNYFAYRPKVPTPQMLYAVVRIHNQEGMFDFVKAFFKGQEKNFLKREAKKVVEK